MNQCNAYQDVSLRTSVVDANPHQLIQLLFDGAIEAIKKAKIYMSYNMTAEKGHFISKSISIIGGLQDALNKEQGGEVADNLDRLYDYLNTELTLANAHNDPKKLDELLLVLNELSEGWKGIA